MDEMIIEMMEHRVKLRKFRVGKSTLAQMYHDITSRSYPFINFQVRDKQGNLLMHVPIAWARFRVDEENHNLMVVRSTDCEPSCTCCNYQYFFIPKAQMDKYIFIESKNEMHYVFMLVE